MKHEVYRAEVGDLLTPDDEEFECYSGVYDKKYGYYDTNVVYSLDLSECKQFIKDESPYTDYGIITSDILNLTDEDVEEIESQDYFCEWSAWSEDDIVYKEIRR